MKELEQKLELERSSARRHESQISRLRHQLERLQDEKSEDVSHKSSDALNRAQKQIRELRAELQEAERKEQEVAKKKRNTVSCEDNSGVVVLLYTLQLNKSACPAHCSVLTMCKYSLRRAAKLNGLSYSKITPERGQPPY